MYSMKFICILLIEFLYTALVSLYYFLWRYSTDWQFLTTSLALLSIFYYRVQSTSQSDFALMIFWLNVILTFLLGYRNIFWIQKHSILYMTCIGTGPTPDTKANLSKFLDTNLICSLLISALVNKEHNVVLLPALIFILETSYNLCDNLYRRKQQQQQQQQQWQRQRLSSGDNNALVWKTLITIFTAQTFYFYQVCFFF